MSNVVTESFYCNHHSLSDCPDCTDLHTCYYCGAITDTYAIDEDESVGYRGRLYYCPKHEDRVVEEGLL